ncbi:MAG: UDP-N-acetylglucosamine 2-epimerase (non-hydrolyzing) [Bacteroidia bacterium]
MTTIYVLIGTRPNFIKVTQFKKEVAKYPNLAVKLIHTGQHSGAAMADVFFEQFELQPDYFLNIAQASPIQQIAAVLVELETLINTIGKPNYLMVVGDVNSTLAGTLVANKMEIPLMHLESGLRSFDNTMPEEHNRIVTDALTNCFFTTEEVANENLLAEKKSATSLHYVGNTMIDTLVAFEQNIDASTILEDKNIIPTTYCLMTMHRPSNVDTAEGLSVIVDLIQHIATSHKVVFPIHPRTYNNLKKYNLLNVLEAIPNLLFTEPLDYFAFQKLIKHSAFVITDSGGVQEETTFNHVPCLTLRDNTERPVTCTLGTNTLCNAHNIKPFINQIIQGTYKKGTIPPLWDGKATQRIVEVWSKL